MLIVEVTEGGSVNMCTPFCLIIKSGKRPCLRFNDHKITKYLSFNCHRNFLKYQFDAWRDKVSIYYAGRSFIIFSWQSPRDGVSIKTLCPIIILGWHQERHPVIRFCQIWIYEMTKIIDKLNCINGIGAFQSEDATQR